MSTETVKVEGMSCGHCKAAVEGALNKVTGVKSSEVDLASGTVQVSFDEEKTTREELYTEIEDAGYDVVR
ncbi:copper chaperone CopZ [Bacillus sp. FJAT-45037]|uniref:copper chaperone CopZ n=1 Tax=Bacillus sp. FJAT-45037 TaxID=2011007 RepID=UPI000C23E740|nr:copper chaperone CopZ [Bacillus sp. FJAT-45037]